MQVEQTILLVVIILLNSIAAVREWYIDKTIHSIDDKRQEAMRMWHAVGGIFAIAVVLAIGFAPLYVTYSIRNIVLLIAVYLGIRLYWYGALLHVIKRGIKGLVYSGRNTLDRIPVFIRWLTMMLAIIAMYHWYKQTI